ncbi:MAG: PqqD family protein [Patescibacteria group bacterium]|mgnify:FL=1
MKYKINKGLITQKLDNKTVIFDGDESILYTFNETASYIFKKIKSGEDEERIINLIVKRYQIKPEKAKKDLRDLLVDLKKKKIISSLKLKK